MSLLLAVSAGGPVDLAANNAAQSDEDGLLSIAVAVVATNLVQSGQVGATQLAIALVAANAAQSGETGAAGVRAGLQATNAATSGQSATVGVRVGLHSDPSITFPFHGSHAYCLFDLGGLFYTLASVEHGAVGNLFRFALVADGTGIGSLTKNGFDYTFHFEPSVTTTQNLVDTFLANPYGEVEILDEGYPPEPILLAWAFGFVSFEGGSDRDGGAGKSGQSALLGTQVGLAGVSAATSGGSGTLELVLGLVGEDGAQSGGTGTLSASAPAAPPPPPARTGGGGSSWRPRPKAGIPPRLPTVGPPRSIAIAGTSAATSGETASLAVSVGLEGTSHASSGELAEMARSSEIAKQRISVSVAMRGVADGARASEEAAIGVVVSLVGTARGTSGSTGTLDVIVPAPQPIALDASRIDARPRRSRAPRLRAVKIGAARPLRPVRSTSTREPRPTRPIRIG